MLSIIMQIMFPPAQLTDLVSHYRITKIIRNNNYTYFHLSCKCQQLGDLVLLCH